MSDPFDQQPPWPAGRGGAMPAGKCPRCFSPVAGDAAFCQSCGVRLLVSQPAPAAAGFVVAGGRLRTAGWLVAAGGAAILLSAFLPWFNFLGLVSANLPAAYFFVFGASGAVVAYFGLRALKDRVTRPIMLTLWILSSVAALVAVGLFSAASDVQNQSFGTVSPSSGFYLGLLGLVTTVVGTIVLQTTRRGQAAIPGAAGAPGGGLPG
jgi:hypothetical protein